MLLLAACAPESTADPWEDCTGYFERDVAETSTLFVVSDAGRPTVVAVTDWGVRWDTLWPDLGGMTAAGKAPFNSGTLDVVGAARDGSGLSLLSSSVVRPVVTGFSEPDQIPWTVVDDAEHGFVHVRNAWVVDEQIYVATAEETADTVLAGLATADSDGVIVPLTDTFLAVDLDSPYLRLDGGWDPDAGQFLLTSAGGPGALWRVSSDGRVSEDVLAVDVPVLAQWVPLGDGRWTGLSTDALVVFDPDEPGSLVEIERETLAEPFRSGVVRSLPGGGAVALSHVDGRLTIQAWDGDDPAAGARFEADYVVEGCAWFENLVMEAAR